jgi:hypothetical protein
MNDKIESIKFILQHQKIEPDKKQERNQSF